MSSTILHPVPEPFGTAPLQGLPDGRKPEGLAGMDGGVEVLPLDKRESLEVESGRITRLGPGHVEAGHPNVAVPHGQLGDLEGTGSGAHGCEQRPHHDGPTGRSGLLHASGKASEHSLDDRLQVEPGLGMELGSEAHLGVNDAVLGQNPPRTRELPARGPLVFASPPRCG